MTPEETVKAQTIGQQLFDLLHDRCEAEHVYDFNVVMTLLISIVAHFMAGIDDEELRVSAFKQFGENLCDHINHLRASRPDARAQIILKDQLQ